MTKAGWDKATVDRQPMAYQRRMMLIGEVVGELERDQQRTSSTFPGG